MGGGTDWNGLFTAAGVFLVLAAVVVGGVVVGLIPLPILSGYEHTTVTIYDEEGTERGSVQVRVADTFSKRYTGLSDTESLAPNEGMLFVYDTEANRTFVMRDMAFSLDIVFVGADGYITRIAYAPVPPPRTPDRELTPYRGRAKWVLEVNGNWTTDHGVTAGDRVDVES